MMVVSCYEGAGVSLSSPILFQTQESVNRAGEDRAGIPPGPGDYPCGLQGGHVQPTHGAQGRAHLRQHGPAAALPQTSSPAPDGGRRQWQSEKCCNNIYWAQWRNSQNLLQVKFVLYNKVYMVVHLKCLDIAKTWRLRNMFSKMWVKTTQWFSLAKGSLVTNYHYHHTSSSQSRDSPNTSSFSNSWQNAHQVPDLIRTLFRIHSVPPWILLIKSFMC